jgi:transposase, IS30 family
VLGRRLSEQDKAEIWRRLELGESMRSIARRLSLGQTAVRTYVASCGGRRPQVVEWSPRRLSLADREEISRGLAAGDSLRAIARRLGRAPSTVSREVNAGGGRRHYRAVRADRAAHRRARRPKQAKLAMSPRLRAEVEDKLGLLWSPQQISKWLRWAYPNDPEMRVSHETIYLSLYVQGRGALRRELAQALRSGRASRRPRHIKGGFGQGQINDMVMISERPAEANDRAVPGHWEGDLIFGRRMTAIGTLVERWSRYVMLFPLPQGHNAEAVRVALEKSVQRLPEQLRQSVTWDQGKEMAQHVRFTVDTGVQVYFCDPKSPWQRGSNENTNGLLRQYLPKTTDMSKLTQKDLDAIAASLNGRPRQTLDWRSPSQKFAEAVATIP